MCRFATWLLFPVSLVVQSLRGKEMMDQEFSKNYDDGELAEKCRRALEKSYGIEIPMPKCIAKKVNMYKA
jgi:hypothetical protein